MKKKLQFIHHLVVGLILFLKGLDKIQHHYGIIGWVILLLGGFILLYFVFQKISKKDNNTFETIVHFFESVALFLTSYVYFIEGKTFLPYITLSAAIGFLVAVFLHGKGHNENRS